MARTIEDCAFALNIIGVQDNNDWMSIRPEKKIDYLKNLNKPLKDLKIAYSLDFNGT
jgi:Asp-tRNA(Asn)/Glu-tRNA(Gln) amidotransferase A subunit family amidase